MKRLALILTFCLWASSLYPQGEPYKTLKNIRSCRVVIEHLPETAKSFRLTEEQLQTDMELKLQMAGIKVDSEFAPFLYVAVTIQLNKNFLGTTGYSAMLIVQLRQFVTVEINGVRSIAGTWERSGIIGGPKQISEGERIRQMVRDYADQFVNEYLAANPKP